MSYTIPKQIKCLQANKEHYTFQSQIVSIKAILHIIAKEMAFDLWACGNILAPPELLEQFNYSLLVLSPSTWEIAMCLGFHSIKVRDMELGYQFDNFGTFMCPNLLVFIQ